MLRLTARRRLRGWPLLAALGATQTVGYGVLYYAFAVYLTPMASDLHASTATVTGALTLAPPPDTPASPAY